MPNQHTPPASRRPTKSFSVRLTSQDRATLNAGAKALSEPVGDTLRAGGLERAARGLAGGKGVAYRCAYCPAKFVTEFDADAHIETAHPETP